MKSLSTTSNAISLTWSEAGSVSLSGFEIEISWQRRFYDLCQYEDANSAIINGLMSNVTIYELEEYSNYSITVTIGSLINNSTIAVTKESGMLY